MSKNGLGFAPVQVGRNVVPLLTYKGEVLPGQCALEIGDANKHGVRKVQVIFEVQCDKMCEALLAEVYGG